eukprot:7951244-Alexandrium_andersonii.AAC.1
MPPPSLARSAAAPPVPPPTPSSPDATPTMLSVKSVAVGAGTRCAVQTGATGVPCPPFLGPVVGGPRWRYWVAMWKMSPRSPPLGPPASMGPSCPADHMAAVPRRAGPPVPQVLPLAPLGGRCFGGGPWSRQ